jgi:hypothetical protein
VGTSEEAEANLTSDIEKALASNPPPSLIERLQSALRYKRLCTTTDGHVVLVLGDSQVGDYIFSARGATCPFILRPTADDQPYGSIKQALKIQTFYHFVGCAYVHGMMDGEPLREMEAEGVKEEVVFLI